MATTFVSSTFFFKTTKGFDKVTLILGISDGEQQEKFDQKLWNLQDRLLPKKKIEWWNSLDKDTREAIRKQKIKVRYGKIDVAVHSKIYLLQGKAGTRVVVGSANLTSRAFGNKTQFEELLIFDNSPLYETYKDRFNQLMQNTEDFINELSNQLPKEKTVMINTNDPEIIMKLVEDEISKMVCFSEAIISEEQLEQLRELPSAKEKEEEEAKQLLHLICFLTRKRHNKPEYELISQKNFKEKIPAVKTTLCKSNEQATLKDNRIILLFDHRNCTLKRGDCLGEADLREKKQEYLATLQTFSAPVRLDLIKDRLMLINEFVESYSKFTIFKDPEISKRVMECILYAFSSPYLWLMRDVHDRETGSENARTQFKPFLIIAGRAKTGKTTLLEFISHLIGNLGQFVQYVDVSKPGVIYDFFQWKNLCPILVDELNTSFFRSKRKELGEELIKNVTNAARGEHPVLIGTTNATDFSIPPQAERRLYYIGINNTFDDKLRSYSEPSLRKIMDRADSLLFKDFSWRLSQLIRQNETLFALPDFLFVTRNIFKQYYNECGMEVPSWFLETIFEDYRERGRIMWREIYDSYRKHFRPKENKIVVNLEKIKQKTHDQKDLVNYLPSECIIEDNVILILNQKEFFKFIGRRKFTVKDRLLNFFK